MNDDARVKSVRDNRKLVQTCVANIRPFSYQAATVLLQALECPSSNQQQERAEAGNENDNEIEKNCSNMALTFRTFRVCQCM